MRPLLILSFLFILSSSSAIRGEWYESYKEDLVPKHVPVEAPRIPRVHGVSRGEWHVAYPPVISRTRRNNEFLQPASEFVSRLRNEIRRKFEKPLRRVFRVKREEDGGDYGSYDQYPVESNEYLSRDEVKPHNLSFFDRLRDNLSSMMNNIRGFFSFEEQNESSSHLKDGSLNNLDRENAPFPHHQQNIHQHIESPQPTVLERMRRDFHSMMGRVASLFGGPSSHKAAPNSQQQPPPLEDEFYEFNQEFAPSSPQSFSHERNYANHHSPGRDSSNGPSFLDGLRDSLSWLRTSFGGSNEQDYYPGAPLPSKAYAFEPTEKKFGGPPPLSVAGSPK